MVLIDSGSDIFDGFHEFLDLVAGGYFVIENRGNELGMFFEGGDWDLLILLCFDSVDQLFPLLVRHVPLRANWRLQLIEFFCVKPSLFGTNKTLLVRLLNAKFNWLSQVLTGTLDTLLLLNVWLWLSRHYRHVRLQFLTLSERLTHIFLSVCLWLLFFSNLLCKYYWGWRFWVCLWLIFGLYGIRQCWWWLGLFLLLGWIWLQIGFLYLLGELVLVVDDEVIRILQDGVKLYFSFQKTQSLSR